MNNLAKYFSYQKLKSPPYKILFLNNAYFLQNETIHLLKKLGHKVFDLKIQSDPKIMLNFMLKSCVEFKPDFIMGMNHLGFDDAGKTSQILNELNIPVVFWYLDDFRFIIKKNINLAKPNTLIFTFETNNQSALKNMGFEHVHFLPTATPLNLQSDFSNKKFSYLNNAITFVGNTFEKTKNTWQKAEYTKYLENLDRENLDIDNESIIDFISKHQSSLFKENYELLHYAGYVTAHLTQKHRMNIIESINNISNEVHIFGDEKWKDFDLNFIWHPPVHNLKIAPSVYFESGINLNISSLQLETAVNLRVFDVPAAGGFLITDWKENLDSLFDVKKDLVVFRSDEELKDKILFYSKNKNLKDKIINSARERIIREHLLEHRIQKMIQIIEKTFQ